MVKVKKDLIRQLYAAKIELEYLKENGLIQWDRYPFLHSQFFDRYGYTYAEYAVFQANFLIQDAQNDMFKRETTDWQDRVIYFQGKALKRVLLDLPSIYKDWFLVKNADGTVYLFEHYPEFHEKSKRWYPVKGTNYKFLSDSKVFDLITYHMQPLTIGEILGL